MPPAPRQRGRGERRIPEAAPAASSPGDGQGSGSSPAMARSLLFLITGAAPGPVQPHTGEPGATCRGPSAAAAQLCPRRCPLPRSRGKAPGLHGLLGAEQTQRLQQSRWNRGTSPDPVPAQHQRRHRSASLGREQPPHCQRKYANQALRCKSSFPALRR